MLKKELLFCFVNQTYPDLCDGTLIINGDLIVNENLYINGNLQVNGSITGSGTVYVSRTATVSGSIGNLKQQAIFRHYDLSCDDGTTTFNGNTTFENNTVSITNTSDYGIENTARFDIYCKVEATGTKYGVYNNKGTITISGTLIATATSTFGYGVYNYSSTFIVKSGGYVEATGADYGVNNGNNTSSTFTVEGTLIATATSNSGYGVYNNSSTFIVKSGGYVEATGTKYGVYNYGTFTIESGGYVKATCNTEAGVYNYGTFTIESGGYVEATGTKYGACNYLASTFTVKGTLIATATSNYGIFNRYPTGKFIIESGGYVEATGADYGVNNGNNTSGTFTVEGTLIATATSNSGYGVYTSSGIFILNGTCYVVVKNTSYAVKGTITGTGTLYVNGVETEF